MATTQVVIVLLLVVEVLPKDMYLFNPSDSIEREYDHLRRNQRRPEPNRGHLFGLDKFISQSLNLESDFKPASFAVQPEQPQRGNPRTKKNKERGQTYGLENFAPQIFQLSSFPQDSSEVNIAEAANFEMTRMNMENRRPQSFDALPVEPVKRRPQHHLIEQPRPLAVQTESPPQPQPKPKIRKHRPEKHRQPIVEESQTAASVIIPEEFHIFPEDNKPKGFRKYKERHETFDPLAFLALGDGPEDHSPEPVVTTTTEAEHITETQTPRPRKRIMLRRRKKKPQVEVTTEELPVITPDESNDFPNQEREREKNIPDFPLQTSPTFDSSAADLPIPTQSDEEQNLPSLGDDSIPEPIKPKEEEKPIEKRKKPFLPRLEDGKRRPLLPRLEEPPRRTLHRNENEFKLKLEKELNFMHEEETKPTLQPLQPEIQTTSEPETEPTFKPESDFIPKKEVRVQPPKLEEEQRTKHEDDIPLKHEKNFRLKSRRPIETKRQEPPPVEQLTTESSQTSNDLTNINEVSNNKVEPQKIEDRNDKNVENKPQPSPHHLKTLLKQQSGTLSLSELLQTQNLSLADFLRGNKGAISALGGKRVTSKDNEEEPTTVKPEEQPLPEKRIPPRIPKISSKSRPFSKTINDIKSDERLSKVKEEQPESFPKVLDVIEITTDKTTYNGFQPKNPRNRQRLDRLPKTENVKTNENLEFSKVSPKNRQVESRLHPEPTENPKNNELETPTKRERNRLASRMPTSTTIVPSESTTSEPRLTPKRFGDLRTKIRIDRRKHTTPAEITTEDLTSIENEIITTPKPTESEKSIVKIPFQSSNNPDLSLIVPNRNRTQWADRRNKDRLSPMRNRNHEKEEKEETTTEQVENIFSKFKFRNSKPKSTTVETTTEELLTTKSQSPSTESFQILKSVEIQEDDNKSSQKDEILELLRSGSSAQRLARILAARNMTLDELIENRERETPKINFDLLFDETEQKEPDLTTTTTSTTTTTTTTKKPARVNSETIKDINQFLFPNFPDFNSKKKQKNGINEQDADESYPAIIQVRPNPMLETRDPRGYAHFPPTDSAKPAPPVWPSEEKTMYGSQSHGYPTYETKYPGRGILKSRVNPVQETPKPYEVPIDNNLGESEDIILLETYNKSAATTKNLKNSIDEILKEQSEVHQVKEEYTKTLIPPAVRSAIIASGVVLGIALFVFIAIFVACGCRQRQIRLRGKGSILSDSLSRSNSNLKNGKRNTLSPVSFKRTGMYRKALDFETASSISNSSNASSYLWNTLKNTFQSRNSTLKNLKNEEVRQENERRNTGKKEKAAGASSSATTGKLEETERRNTLRRGGGGDDERNGIFTKIDPDRSIPGINTSLTFKRGGLNSSNAGRFNTCAHLNN